MKKLLIRVKTKRACTKSNTVSILFGWKSLAESTWVILGIVVGHSGVVLGSSCDHLMSSLIILGSSLRSG